MTIYKLRKTHPHKIHKYKGSTRLSKLKLDLLKVLGGVCCVVNAPAMAQDCPDPGTLPNPPVTLVNVDRQILQCAILNAKRYFSARNVTNTTYEIVLPPKWITIRANASDQPKNSQGLIHIEDFDPGPGNKLVIRGTGRTEYAACQCELSNTTLDFPWDHTSISGDDARNVEFNNIHFTKNRVKVSQGVIRKLDPAADYLKINLERGFPSLASADSGGIMGEKHHGRKLRQYTLVSDPNSPTGKRPRLVRPPAAAPGGVVWEKAEPFYTGDNPATARVWKVYTKPRWHRNFFASDQLVGIKSKHGKHAYYFTGGYNIRFNGVQWTQETRGVFRGVNGVTVNDSYAGPDPFLNTRLGRRNEAVVAYLASSGGGPQIGSHDDYPLNYDWRDRPEWTFRIFTRSGGSFHKVYSNEFRRLGDDPIGLFHVEGNVLIANNDLVEGPARAIFHLNRCAEFCPANTNCFASVSGLETNRMSNTSNPPIERRWKYNVVPKWHNWSDNGRRPNIERNRCLRWFDEYLW